MSFVQRHRVTVTTDASSAATAYSENIRGRIMNVLYYRDGTTPMSTTADITLTVEATSQVILASTGVDASYTKAPRQTIHNTTGGTVMVTTTGSLPFVDYIGLGNDRVKITVVNGGAAKVGTFDIIVD